MDYPWKLFVREMLTWTLKKAPKYWGLFAVSFYDTHLLPGVSSIETTDYGNGERDSNPQFMPGKSTRVANYYHLRTAWQ
jgi:hypothetical protein